MRKLWIVAAVAGIGVLGSAAIGVSNFRARTHAAEAPKRELLLAPAQPANASLATLDIAAKARPGDAAAWARLGDFHLRASAFPAAIEAYRKALAIDPNRSETWSAIGEAYIQSKPGGAGAMPAEAKEAFARTLALDPHDLRARFYATMERDFAGQHDRAIGEWLAMLREAPMGSDADEAIRAAMAASINRNLILIKAEMSRATQEQPRIVPALPAKS